jgi:hypothetical protein
METEAEGAWLANKKAWINANDWDVFVNVNVVLTKYEAEKVSLLDICGA